MDLWVKILLGLAVPFLFIVIRTVYRLLHLQDDLEKTKHVVLSRELIDQMVKSASEEYSKELDLEQAISVLVQKLTATVSVTSISFLIPVTENSTDYTFKTHLVYEVPEAYVKDEQQALTEFAKEKFELKIENISRNVEGGPINSKSKIKALSREIYPLDIGSLKGAISISSRKSSHFSEVLKQDFKSLIDTTSSFLAILWQVARREHKKFKAMVDSMRDGVFMVDEEYRFLIANPALKEMMGMRSTAAVNIVRVSNFFSLHLSIEDVISEVFVMGKVKKVDNIDIEDKIYGLTAIPVKLGNVVVGVVCLLEDQTHQKELEEMRRDFSAMIIHELRSPLSVIRGTSNFMLKESENIEPPQKKEFLHRIEDSASELLNLVGNLLDSAKIESGNIEVFKEKTNLNDLVKNQIDYFANSFKQKGVTLEGTPDVSIPEVQLDPDKMHQVINNLLSNGLKYTPEGGQVVIGTKMGEGTLRLFVEDTGKGIKDANKEHIFEKYKRMEKGSEDKSTGLGLAISKGIVEAHGGKIWVEDNEPQGSRFIVELPVEA